MLGFGLWMRVKRQLGEMVKVRRKSLGLSQIELAREAGLHWNYVGGVERGERNISLVNIHKLARALKVEAGELVGTPRKYLAIRRALKQLEKASLRLKELNEIMRKGGDAGEASEQLRKLLEKALGSLRGALGPQ